MLSTYVLQRAIVLCLVAVAVCMDLKKEKVSNEWILCGWAVGSFWQIWSGGIRGLAVFFLGALLPLTILFLLYYLRMLGAADLKLLSAVGGIIGPKKILVCMLYSFFLGAILAFLLLVARRSLAERLRYFFHYLWNFIRTKEFAPYGLTGNRPENMHFTVPVFLGVLFWIGGYY